MTTIREVADHAGVSVATVSRVINKTGYVSSNLQTRVTAAMRALNYHPSALARSLRRQETQTIGVLLPQLNHPFFGTLAYAIEKTLFPVDYRTFICSAEENPEQESSYIDILLRQRVDGIILVPTDNSSANARRLFDQQIPVVLVDRDVPELDISRVLANNEMGAYRAAKFLLELGHTRIATIGGPTHSEPMRLRFHGVRRALAEAGLTGQIEVTFDKALDHFRVGYESAVQLLLHAPRPTAIFALTDTMAMGVIHAAVEHGLKVPDDLSVVGYDDIAMAAYSLPALTCVAQPIYRMGEYAARRLLSQIIEPDQPPQTIVLETSLIVRKSTAPPLV